MKNSRHIADIHPESLIGNSRLLNEEAAASAGTATNPRTPETACPICNSGDLEKFASLSSWAVSRCRGCDFRFTNPPPSAQQLKSYYRGPAKTAENEIFEATRETRLRMFRQRADMVLRHVTDGKLLEVGGATGLFIDAVLERAQDFEITAVELSPDACERLKRRWTGIRIVNSSIYDHHELHDVIAIWDTLPYLPDPGAAIGHIAGLLRPGGHLFLNTLNTTSLEHEIAGSDHPQFQPFPTINYFNKDNLALLLKSHDFEILETATPNAHFDVRFARQIGDSAEFRQRLGQFLTAHLEDDEFAADFADLLRKHRLGGNVSIAAKFRGTAA